MKKLTPRQGMFVLEFLVDHNATRAAIRAGYSKNGAKVQGARLLTNVNVAAAIQRADNERAERLEITADRVTQEVARLAFFDPKYVYNTLDGGELQMKTFEEMGPWSRCIAEVKEDRIIKEVSGTKNKPDSTMVLADKRTLKFHDKTSNLRTLCEHLGILKNQQPIFPPSVTFRFVYEEPQKPDKGKE